MHSYFIQACHFSEFFLILGFFFQISICLHIFLKEEKYPLRKERSSTVYYVQISSFSFLCGCGVYMYVNPPKWNIQEVQGALSSRSKRDPGPLPMFSNHTPVDKNQEMHVHVHVHVCTECTETNMWMFHNKKICNKNAFGIFVENLFEKMCNLIYCTGIKAPQTEIFQGSFDTIHVHIFILYNK